MIDTRCTVCKTDANTLSKDLNLKGMFCVFCQKFFCSEHRKVRKDGSMEIKTCHSGHDNPRKEQCATCNALIWYDGKYIRGGVHCGKCGAYYCYKHCKTTEWQRVAAGVDNAIRDVTCDKGHTFMESESNC
jgi:hypothetical protein